MRTIKHAIQPTLQHAVKDTILKMLPPVFLAANFLEFHRDIRRLQQPTHATSIEWRNGRVILAHTDVDVEAGEVGDMLVHLITNIIILPCTTIATTTKLLQQL